MQLIETATHSIEMFSGCLEQKCVTLHLMCNLINVQCCVVTVRILDPFGLHYCSDFLKCQSHSTHLSTSLRDRMNIKRQNSREQIQSTRRRGNKTFSTSAAIFPFKLYINFKNNLGCDPLVEGRVSFKSILPRGGVKFRSKGTLLGQK